MLSKVFPLLALAARASAFTSFPKAREEASIGARMSYTAFTSLASTGPCQVSGSCVCTSNYDDKCEQHSGEYANNEVCVIDVPAGSMLSVTHFETENGYDKLILNGNEYQGSTGPNGVALTSAIRWYSDSSVQKSGWKLCVTTAAQLVAEQLDRIDPAEISAYVLDKRDSFPDLINNDRLCMASPPPPPPSPSPPPPSLPSPPSPPPPIPSTPTGWMHISYDMFSIDY